MAKQLFCTRLRTTIQLDQRYDGYTVWNDTSCVMVSCTDPVGDPLLETETETETNEPIYIMI